MVDCGGDNTAVIWDRVVFYVLHVGYNCPYTQGQRGVPQHRPCGGALEGHRY